MKEKAYKQYLTESNNWLHTGRSLLLRNCLQLSCPTEPKCPDKIRILEIGAGSGKNIKMLANYGTVDAVEIEQMAIQKLSENKLLDKLYTQKVPFPLNVNYNLICSMDFLEHVEDDKVVFKWMVDHLCSGGVLFITVPAYSWLFSFHDTALGHYRRYTTKDLCNLKGSNLELLKKGYFNCTLFPLVAAIRILHRFISINSKPDTKQSSNVPFFIDYIFLLILRIEIFFIRKYSLFPFGLTAFAVFRKC